MLCFFVGRCPRTSTKKNERDMSMETNIEQISGNPANLLRLLVYLHLSDYLQGFCQLVGRIFFSPLTVSHISLSCFTPWIPQVQEQITPNSMQFFDLPNGTGIISSCSINFENLFDDGTPTKHFIHSLLRPRMVSKNTIPPPLTQTTSGGLCWKPWLFFSPYHLKKKTWCLEYPPWNNHFGSYTPITYRTLVLGNLPLGTL